MNMLKQILKSALLATALSMGAVAYIPAAFEAQAAKLQSIEITPEVKAGIEKLNAYFNSFQTLQGELTQISPRGRAAKGVFYLAKPGKLRFEVEPPTPYIMASDGKWLTLTNKKMDKGDQFPLSKTPMRLLVSDKLDLLQEAVVLNFEQSEGTTTIALADKKGSMPGQIILVFDDARNELQQWVIIDGKGQKTTVQLANLEKNVKINPKLFRVSIKRGNGLN